MQRSVGGAGAAGGRISNNRPLSSSRSSQRRRQSPSSGEGGSSKSRRVEQPTLKPPPPPPSFKPPPLPEEDDDVFIRPIGRSRSPNLQVPPAPPVSLSPIGEVDTPESSRSVSPCSMMSQSSSSSRAYSPAPYVISHDSFMKPTNLPTDGQPSWRRTSPARKLSPSLPEAGQGVPQPAVPGPGAPQPAVLKPVQNIETARVEGSKPVRKDTPAIIPRMEIAPATPLQVAKQKENAMHSRIQEEEHTDTLDFDDIQKSSNFGDIDGKFTGSNFKRRQSKKFKINRTAESHPVQETLKVPSADSISCHSDEDFDLESKNLTPKEEYVIKEILNARRSRSRSPNMSEASLSTDTSFSEPKSTKSEQPIKSSTVASKQDSSSVNMTSTVRVEEKSGEIFVPDCVENIADLTVEHVKYMADQKLRQAEVGELGDYFDVPPVKSVEIPQVVIDTAETKQVNKNWAKANVNATALVGDVEKMYEDVDHQQLSPLPQPKQVHPKNIDNSFTKANKTPKDVAVTDLYDEAMEVEEVQFETPSVKTAKEEKISGNLYKVEQQPQPGLVTDIYEQTEIAKERTPDERFNEYEAVMRNVSDNKAKAARAPKDALVGDIHATFETAAEQPVKNGVASVSAAARSEPNRLTKAEKTAANTVGLGAENNVMDKFEEPGRLANTDIASPKVAQNKRVKSSLRKASSTVKDTPVTELTDQFIVTEETPVAADKVYTTVPSVVTAGYATVANNSEQVALYEDIDQPKPRTKKKQAVQPTKAEVSSQPELARASTTAVSPKIQPPIRSTSQQPKLAARAIEPPQPPRRSASTHPPVERSWTREMDSKETKAVSKTSNNAQNSSILFWLLPSLLGFFIYWLFKMFLEKNVTPPEPIHEDLEDYSYFNILRWP